MNPVFVRIGAMRQSRRFIVFFLRRGASNDSHSRSRVGSFNGSCDSFNRRKLEMQNMIQLAKGDKKYRVFFTFNRNTQDFENVQVRFNGAKVPVHPDEMEQLKDTIALEWDLSMIELSTIYKNGHAPTMM
jgi:hypothetical protein